MNTIKISTEDFEYTFYYDPLAGKTLNKEHNPDLPDWSLLINHQCPLCPLKSKDVCHCPPATDLVDVLEVFSNFNSFDEIKVLIDDKRISYTMTSDCQTALSIIFGIILFTSACPILNGHQMFIKFLPHFPDEDQISYHLLAMELIKSFLQYEKDNKEIYVNLNKIKEDLKQINIILKYMLERIRNASKKDANLNAIIRLATTALLVNLNMEEFFERLRSILNFHFEQEK